MVPNGWKLTALEDIAEPSAPIRYGVVQIGEDTTDGIPIVPIKFIDTIAISPLHRASKDIEGKYAKSRVEGGDVLISVKGTIGAVGIVPDGFSGNIAREIARIRPSDKYDSAFIALQLQAEKTQREIDNLTVGTTRREFSIHTVRKFSICVPPLPEQRKIAQILSTWDKAITTTEQLLANSQQQKKALMQQLLTGKKRLLDNNGVRFSEEWEWLKASELFKTVSRKNNSETEELLAVTQDKGVLPRSMLERRVVMPDGSTKGYKLVVPGNFIISLRSFQGGLEYSDYRGLVSPAYTVLEPIRTINDEFYKQYYKSYDFIGHLAVAVIGIRDGKQISYSDFSFLKLPYPGLEEQQKIATVLSGADQEISALQQKLDTLKQEKKALMQQLLTGKRRVKIDHKEVA
ncbi:MAG: restriction endonuclease subunit S [Pseudomonadota bacterium]|jgi:type I restriction enzyme S subunit|nr:restriction endonuclease subunit S [Pseudomonadota bacterium]